MGKTLHSKMTGKSKGPAFRKIDKRLLGTWKSDRIRTFKEWSWTKNISPQKKKRFQSIFGKLEITYTRTKIISSLRHRKWEQATRYKVVATDQTSVAIVLFGELQIKNRRQYNPENLKFAETLFPRQAQISHVHFDKKHYWVSLGTGKNREFFRKIRNTK